MNFQPQPYPLFCARLFRGEVETGRVVGWSVPDGRDPSELFPVVLFDEADSSVTDPRLLDLEDDRYWISEIKRDVKERAQLAQSDAKANR